MSRFIWCALILISIAIWKPKPARTNTEFYADLELAGAYTSNAYLMAEPQWDVIVSPDLDIGLAAAKIWTWGYCGRLDWYLRHPDLTVHRHELYVYANPTWGDQGQNELLIQLAALTSQNTPQYDNLNHLRPLLNAQLSLEPVSWLRLSIEESATYFWYYADAASTSFDSWTRAELTFTISSARTTLTPWGRFGHRSYTDQDYAVTSDDQDQQWQGGLRLSQGLSLASGLSAFYDYTHAVGDSGMVLRKLSQVEFGYLGDDFIFSGHRMGAAFKQLVGENWSFGLDFIFATREYGGWLVLDSGGLATGRERSDKRLEPKAWIAFEYVPEEDSPRAIPSFSTGIHYEYLRQLSNDPLYDADRHFAQWTLEFLW